MKKIINGICILVFRLLILLHLSVLMAVVLPAERTSWLFYVGALAVVLSYYTEES